MSKMCLNANIVGLAHMLSCFPYLHLQAELFNRTPLFASPSNGTDTELAQISRIFSILGTPVEEDWPGIHELKNYSMCATFEYKPAVRLCVSMTSSAE